jgi:hypothetical protein
MSNLYRGPSIDASYQISVHFAKRFQRRRFLEIDQSETRIAFRLIFYSQHTCDRVAMLQLEICKFLVGDLVS